VKQPLLLVPVEWVRLALVAVRLQFDFWWRQDPGESLIVHPLARREVQDATNNLQSLIDGADGDLHAAAILNPWLQYTHMELVQRHVSDPRHQAFEPANVVAQASLVLVLKHKLGSRLLEQPSRSHTVDLDLPYLFHHSREGSFGFFKSICASALANSLPKDDLVDVPDTASEGEPRHSFASHCFTPFARAGRPLRATYSSTHASSSRRSKPIPCLPMGISVRCGRTSALNLFRSIPTYQGALRNRIMRGVMGGQTGLSWVLVVQTRSPTLGEIAT